MRRPLLLLLFDDLLTCRLLPCSNADHQPERPGSEPTWQSCHTLRTVNGVIVLMNKRSVSVAAGDNESRTLVSLKKRVGKV